VPESQTKVIGQESTITAGTTSGQGQDNKPGPFATPKHKSKVSPAATTHKASSHIEGNQLKPSTLQAKEDQPKATTSLSHEPKGHTEPKGLGNVASEKVDGSVPHGGNHQKPSTLQVTEDQLEATTPVVLLPVDLWHQEPGVGKGQSANGSQSPEIEKVSVPKGVQQEVSNADEAVTTPIPNEISDVNNTEPQVVRVTSPIRKPIQEEWKSKKKQ